MKRFKNVLLKVQNTQGFLTVEYVFLAGAIILISIVLLTYLSKYMHLIGKGSGASFQKLLDMVNGEAGSDSGHTNSGNNSGDGNGSSSGTNSGGDVNDGDAIGTYSLSDLDVVTYPNSKHVITGKVENYKSGVTVQISTSGGDAYQAEISDNGEFTATIPKDIGSGQTINVASYKDNQQNDFQSIETPKSPEGTNDSSSVTAFSKNTVQLKKYLPVKLVSKQATKTANNNDTILTTTLTKDDIKDVLPTGADVTGYSLADDFKYKDHADISKTDDGIKVSIDVAYVDEADRTMIVEKDKGSGDTVTKKVNGLNNLALDKKILAMQSQYSMDFSEEKMPIVGTTANYDPNDKSTMPFAPDYLPPTIEMGDDSFTYKRHSSASYRNAAFIVMPVVVNYDKASTNNAIPTKAESSTLKLNTATFNLPNSLYWVSPMGKNIGFAPFDVTPYLPDGAVPIKAEVTKGGSGFMFFMGNNLMIDIGNTNLKVYTQGNYLNSEQKLINFSKYNTFTETYSTTKWFKGYYDNTSADAEYQYKSMSYSDMLLKLVERYFTYRITANANTIKVTYYIDK